MISHPNSFIWLSIDHISNYKQTTHIQWTIYILFINLCFKFLVFMLFIILVLLVFIHAFIFIFILMKFIFTLLYPYWLIFYFYYLNTCFIINRLLIIICFICSLSNNTLMSHLYSDDSICSYSFHLYFILFLILFSFFFIAFIINTLLFLSYSISTLLIFLLNLYKNLI